LDHKTEKADIIVLTSVLCVMHGFHADLAKKNVSAIEL
jgi:hypothetical protein